MVEVAEDGLSGRVDVEGGGDQIELRGLGREAGLRKVAVMLEVADAGECAVRGIGMCQVVMANANPVVEALHGELEVFVGFHLDDGEAIGLGEGEEVEHAAIEIGAGSGKRGDLGVDGSGLEIGVKGRESCAESAFEPALGLRAEEWILCGVGVGRVGGSSAATIEQVAYELAEMGLGGRQEEGFSGAGADGHFKLPVEGLAREGGADAGKFETVQEEGELGVGAKTEFAGVWGSADGGVAVSGRWRNRPLRSGWDDNAILLLLNSFGVWPGGQVLLEAKGGGVGWKQGEHLRDGGREALERSGLRGDVQQARGEVAVVDGVEAGEVFGLFIEFEELVAGDAGVEPGKPRECDRGGSAGNDDAEAPVEAALARGGGGGVVAAVLEPENADGEDAVDGVLRLGGVDGDHGPGLLAAAKRTASVAGAEGAFEIHGGTEALAAVVRKGLEEHTIEEAQIAMARGIAAGGAAEVLVGGEFQGVGARLTEALRGEAERFGARGDGKDAADEVAIAGPEMEGGAVVLGGESVLGFTEIEEGTTVLEQDRVRVFGQKSFNRGGDVGGCLGLRDGAGCCGGRHGLTVATGCWTKR